MMVFFRNIFTLAGPGSANDKRDGPAMYPAICIIAPGNRRGKASLVRNRTRGS
jgi:hypothetical protein